MSCGTLTTLSQMFPTSTSFLEVTVTSRRVRERGRKSENEMKRNVNKTKASPRLSHVRFQQQSWFISCLTPNSFRLLVRIENILWVKQICFISYLHTIHTFGMFVSRHIRRDQIHQVLFIQLPHFLFLLSSRCRMCSRRIKH